MSDHYFAATPESKATPRTVTFSAYGQAYTLGSSTGVFSGDRLDLGTSVLMREVPLPARPGTFLDLGCGWGPIAAVLATQVPGSTVWAVDVNTRALDLTRDNAARLGVAERVRVAAPDDVPGDVRFDQIWSNPPIRIGKPALHALLERWLPRLAPDGVAWLVVGRNLGADSLQRWLAEQGWRCERHASAKGFRVLAVRPPA
ncbi:class I SAM-dependent methyltransferase [Actinopolymorpha singaporensis]|uniref:Methyltransferase small domain-containing protein n=1 Tax=Actinopolymorpha singaporensis TaxID=117157 RepID=A0A1H1SDV2_9ACTN|nr:methyltransferase [Actinopolymorpha singaporensis]SDS46165.1 Methyltransferase small domain-containing protein [Actinopolymorpha singaporensis]